MNDRLSTVGKFIMSAAAFVVVVAGMKAAASLLVPFLLSIFIALICSPLLIWLRARGIPNWAAIFVIMLLIVASGTLVGAILGASIADFRNQLPAYQGRLQEMSSGVQQWLAAKGVELDADLWRQSFDPGVVMQLVGNMLASFGNVMTNAFLILLTVIFILAEETGFRQRLSQARAGSETSIDAIARFTDGINRYLGVKTMLSLLTGVLVVVLLWALGVDYPLLWGLLSFLLNFVPAIGSTLAAVPAVLLALIQLGPLVAGVATVGFMVINVAIDNVLAPRIMGRELDLSPLVVLLSLIFWGWVLGPVGMLLSIPLTIMVKIALENDRSTSWLGTMLGGDTETLAEQCGDAGGPPPSPPSPPAEP